MTVQTTTIFAIATILAAAAVGSFVCVVIERLPVELDAPDEFGDSFGSRPWSEVVGGSSRCSSCGSPIAWHHKVPVVSWVLLRGRCKECGSRIPGFHPIVELAVPLLVAVLLFGLGWTWRIGPVLWLVPVGIAVAAIDLRTLIVPTKLVWPAFVVSVAIAVAVAALESSPRWLFGGLIGVVTIAGPLAVVWFILPGGMGFGDVRLATLLGWTVGFATIDGSWVTALFTGVATLALAAVIGVMTGVVGIVACGRGRKVPFGPALVVASFAVILLGSVLIEGFAIA